MTNFPVLTMKRAGEESLVIGVFLFASQTVDPGVSYLELYMAKYVLLLSSRVVTLMNCKMKMLLWETSCWVELSVSD